MTSRATHALFNGNQKIDQNKKPALLRLAQKGNPPVGKCGQAESIHSNLLPLLEILPLTPQQKVGPVYLKIILLKLGDNKRKVKEA